MINHGILVGKITAQGNLSAKVKMVASLVGVVSKAKVNPVYDGDYEVTPKASEQSLQTKDKVMTDDIKIKAIPKEYGLITYDQNRTITVS